LEIPPICPDRVASSSGGMGGAEAIERVSLEWLGDEVAVKEDALGSRATRRASLHIGKYRGTAASSPPPRKLVAGESTTLEYDAGVLTSGRLYSCYIHTTTVITYVRIFYHIRLHPPLPLRLVLQSLARGCAATVRVRFQQRPVHHEESLRSCGAAHKLVVDNSLWVRYADLDTRHNVGEENVGLRLGPSQVICKDRQRCAEREATMAICMTVGVRTGQVRRRRIREHLQVRAVLCMYANLAVGS
jgi:hypothetical protein